MDRQQQLAGRRDEPADVLYVEPLMAETWMARKNARTMMQ
jgi:hypothetical protein